MSDLDCLPREYIVTLAGGLELDVKASTPQMACEIVRLMHASLGNAIVYVGPFDGEDKDELQVRGRCHVKDCGEWVFLPADEDLPGRAEKVVCDHCRRGQGPAAPMKRGPKAGFRPAR